MNPETAINILDNAVATITASRQQHVNLQEAVTTIRRIVDKPKRDAPDPPPAPANE